MWRIYDNVYSILYELFSVWYIKERNMLDTSLYILTNVCVCVLVWLG